MGAVQRPTLFPPVAQVALLVCVAGLVLSVAALSTTAALAAGVAVAGLALAWGWAGALALPSPRGTATVLALGTVAMVLSVAGDRSDPLTWLPAALGGSVLLAFGHQLLRRDGRPRLVESVASVVLGLCVIASGVLLVPLAAGPRASLVAAGMAAIAASALVDVAGRWEPVRPWVVPGALVAGAAAAVLVGAEETHWSALLVLGVAVGALSHAVRAVLCVLPTMAHTRPRLVVAVASVLASGGLVYAVAWLLVDLTAG